MVTEKVRVVAVEEGALWVEAIQRSICGSCRARSGCGQRLLQQLGAKPVFMRVMLAEHSTHRYEVNDQVVIAIPENVVVINSLLAYILPMLFMLGLALLVHYSLTSELYTIIAGAFGLALGFLVVHLSITRHTQQEQLQPVIVSLV